MPVLKQWNEKGALWGIWKVDETPEQLRSLLTGISCVDEELQSLKSPSRKVEYLAVRVLLKELLGYESPIAHRASGKPYLPDSSCCITISHTKGYVAVGLHPERELGIDIEQVSERVKKVVPRFVREDEWAQIESHAPGVQLYELLLLWSAKETLFKVLNQSEVDFLHHLQIAPYEYRPEGGGMKGYEYRTPMRREYDVNYFTHRDFVCTYVVV